MWFYPDRFLDLGIISLLMAEPLAWRFSQLIPRRFGRICVVVSAGIGIFLASISDLWMNAQTGQNLWPSILQQIFVFYPIALSVSCIARIIRDSTAAAESTPQIAWLSLILLACLPAGVYRLARVTQTTDRLQELQSQSRIGEFASLSQDLLTIAPAVSIQNQKLAKLLRPTEQQLQSMKTALTQIQDPVQKARLLAILGRRAEALDTLDIDSSDDQVPAERCLLMGTIYEHESDWKKGEYWYNRARSQLEKTQSKNEKLWATAYRGLGFCHRKQRDNRAAETAYLHLLEVEPTAGTHFLLAQFYQDAQAGKKSAFHLEEAVQLAPELFEEQASEMKAKLQSYQFSCWKVWSN